MHTPNWWGRNLRGPLNARSGSIVFHGRKRKWIHTRDFWQPIGTVDAILTRHSNTRIVCDRMDLLLWLYQRPQMRREKCPPAPNGTPQRGDLLETGARCFQILRIAIDNNGTEGYFYRPNFTANTWIEFLKEDWDDKMVRRAANQAARGERTTGDRHPNKSKR